MEFTINTEKFLKSLDAVVNISTKQILKDFESAGNILFKAEKDELTITANGGTACIVTKFLNSKIDHLNYVWV